MTAKTTTTKKTTNGTQLYPAPVPRPPLACDDLETPPGGWPQAFMRACGRYPEDDSSIPLALVRSVVDQLRAISHLLDDAESSLYVATLLDRWEEMLSLAVEHLESERREAKRAQP